MRVSALIAVVLAATSPLDAARTAFERGDFKQASALLDAATSTTPKGHPLAEVHLLRGRCFAALGQSAQIETAFTLALMNDPEARLDPATVPPDLVATLHALALRLVGRLAVNVTGLSAGDQVTVDGSPLASPELGNSVPIGRRVVAVRRGGRDLAKGEAVVYPGRDTKLELTVPIERPAPVVPPAPPAAEATPERPSRGPFSIAVRTRVDVLRPGATIEAGAELTFGFFRVGLFASMSKSFGVGLRPGVRFKLGERVALGAFAAADVFFSQPVAVSVGGGAALDVLVVGGLELFLELGGQYAVLAPLDIRQGYPLIGAGARWVF